MYRVSRTCLVELAARTPEWLTGLIFDVHVHDIQPSETGFWGYSCACIAQMSPRGQHTYFDCMTYLICGGCRPLPMPMQ
jgi:hypothetical protein